MSDNDIRRPRRIIEAELPYTPGTDLAGMLQTLRFQRALISASPFHVEEGTHERRWGPRPPVDVNPGVPPAPSPSPPKFAPKGASNGAPRKSSNASSKGAAKAGAKGVANAKDAPKNAPKSAPESASNGAPVARPDIAPARPAPAFVVPPMPMFDYSDVVVPPKNAGKDAAKPAGRADDWDQDLCKRIGLLCRKISPDITEWEVTVPLHPVKLPEGSLNIRLSPHRMALRFNTQSAYTLRILSEHQSGLIPMLEKALPYSRDIDIDIT